MVGTDAANREPTLADLGRLLRERRQAQGRSMAELAERLGIDKSALSKLERARTGHYLPPAKDLRALGAAYGVSMAEMLTVTGYLRSSDLERPHMAPGVFDFVETAMLAATNVSTHIKQQFTRYLDATREAWRAEQYGSLGGYSATLIRGMAADYAARYPNQPERVAEMLSVADYLEEIARERGH